MELKWIRKNIDYLDRQIAEKLAQRMDLMTKVAESKVSAGKDITDPGREKEVLENVARVAGVDHEEYVCDIYKTIMEVSKAYQEKLINEGK